MTGRQSLLTIILTGVTLLAGAVPAWAQSFGSGGGGGGGSGGGGSSSGGSSFGSGSGMSSGSSGSFLGNTGSFLNGSTTTTTNTSTNGVGSTSFLGPNYANPLAQGLGSATSTTGGTTSAPAFGATMYNLNTTSGSSYGSSGSRGSGSSGSTRSSSSTSGARSSGYGATSGSSNRGAGGIGSFRSGSTGTSSSQTTFASSAGTLRAPTYNAELAFPMTVPLAANQMRSNLEQVLVNSQRLARPDQVHVEMVKGVAVLRGSVATDHERAVAEAMIRLNPGVGDVRNELVVTP